MDTGVVMARELVSEPDCHAHDTVSAMSYRDRSFFFLALAVVVFGALELFISSPVAGRSTSPAIPVTATFLSFD